MRSGMVTGQKLCEAYGSIAKTKSSSDTRRTQSSPAPATLWQRSMRGSRINRSQTPDISISKPLPLTPVSRLLNEARLQSDGDSVHLAINLVIAVHQADGFGL